MRSTPADRAGWWSLWRFCGARQKPHSGPRDLRQAWRVEGVHHGVLTKRGGEIELDPRATGSCVLTFDEDAASAVRDS